MRLTKKNIKILEKENPRSDHSNLGFLCSRYHEVSYFLKAPENQNAKTQSLPLSIFACCSIKIFYDIEFVPISLISSEYAAFGSGPYWFEPACPSVHINTSSQIPPIKGTNEIRIIQPLFPVS